MHLEVLQLLWLLEVWPKARADRGIFDVASGHLVDDLLDARRTDRIVENRPFGLVKEVTWPPGGGAQGAEGSRADGGEIEVEHLPEWVDALAQLASRLGDQSSAQR
jgi:hypothetical protein